MFQFQIQLDSDIPPSKQLFDQLHFAIASGQYPPGHRLPSTRQLGMLTGLHRNTVSKVYRQLEKIGLVESLTGSGIYVKAQGHEAGSKLARGGIGAQFPGAQEVINQTLEQLLAQGCTLEQVRELFLTEIDWRLRSLAKVLVTVPSRDLEAGQLMVKELEQYLGLEIELVALEELSQILEQGNAATVITNRYFIQEVLGIVTVPGVRVIPLDIYDYREELQLIKSLPSGSYLGLVSLSAGTLAVAEMIIHSLRGYDIGILTAQFQDGEQLARLVRNCQTIISDRAIYPALKQWIINNQDTLFPLPKLIAIQNYIGEQSINMLKRELGLGITKLTQE